MIGPPPDTAQQIVRCLDTLRRSKKKRPRQGPGADLQGDGGLATGCWSVTASGSSLAHISRVGSIARPRGVTAGSARTTYALQPIARKQGNKERTRRISESVTFRPHGNGNCGRAKRARVNDPTIPINEVSKDWYLQRKSGAINELGPLCLSCYAAIQFDMPIAATASERSCCRFIVSPGSNRPSVDP
jgi:hypothetical protein